MRPSAASAAFALALTWGVVWPAGAGAQQHRSARDAYREGIRLAQEGDTTTALARMDDALSFDPTFAPAHFQKGLLHSRMATLESEHMEDRLAALDAFEAAIRADPGNPLYLLEMGKLLLLQQIRVDARRMFERALEAAERADAKTLAEVHFQLALLKETQWVRFRSRHRVPIGIGQLQADLAFADPTYVWDMLERSRTWSGQGAAERETMLDHLDRALQADPAHAGAAAHLAAYYYDEGMHDELLAEARRFTRAAPSEPKAYLALGLGLHALGREDEAAGAFQYALELMPAAEREDFLAVSRLMTKDDAERFDALAGEHREEARRRFWMASDPLFLTPSNEFWVEYQARMAYADLRFGLPEDRIPGWRTDRGTIWVRYGEPPRVATFAPETSYTGDIDAIGRITTVWSYGREGPVFVFRQATGYRRATFANDFRFYADDYRSVQPTRFAAPSIPTLAPMPAQVVRFRGPAGAVELEVHAALPVDSLARATDASRTTFQTGFFVMDPDGREIKRMTGSEYLDLRTGGEWPIRSWSTDVPAGAAHLLSVEARDPLTWASASHRTRVEAKSFPAGEPSVSDLLLSREIEPVVEEPTARHEFGLRPVAPLSFEADEPVGVYFELYNLVPDADRFASYELELVVTVEEIYREGPLSRLLGELADRWGFTEEGEQSVELRFNREVRVLARDMIPEYFNVALDEPPPGRYGLELTVRDRNAGREMTATRMFEVLDDGAGR